MSDILKGLVDDAIESGADDQELHRPQRADIRWKLSVTVALGVLYALVVVGSGATALFKGYATQTALLAQQGQLTEVRAGQLDANILGTRERQCKAIKQANSDAQRFALDRLNDLLYQYSMLGLKQQYRLPDCSELGG